MALNIQKELANLNRMSVDELRAKFAEVFCEPTNTRHKEWLIRRIAWRLQAQAEGDLSERARQRAAELANDSDLRVSAPKTKPTAPLVKHTKSGTFSSPADDRLPRAGTVITRPYKGRTLEVEVLTDGFRFEGDKFKSLSAVAKHITGSHCNGYLFFRLGGAA
jgi:hypothetical protein